MADVSIMFTFVYLLCACAEHAGRAIALLIKNENNIYLKDSDNGGHV